MGRLVEVTVEGVYVHLTPGAEATPPAEEKTTVVLKERDGSRRLSIWVGPAEAFAIASRLDGQGLNRPLTPDLVAAVIQGLGATLTRVVVTSHRESVFYAHLSVGRDGEETDIDARPSDAIAVALRLDAPIFVAEEVFAEATAAA